MIFEYWYDYLISSFLISYFILSLIGYYVLYKILKKKLLGGGKNG